MPTRRSLRLLIVAAWAAAALLGGCARVSTASPDDAIGRVTSQARYATASWGICVRDLDTGEVLYEERPEAWVPPASTTKLYTGAAALVRLGPGYRWMTPVYRRGEVDSGGVLDGSLVLVASGDPTMGGRDLPSGRLAWGGIDHTDAGSDGTMEAELVTTSPTAGLAALAAQVRASGIRRVRDVSVDDRLFEPYGTDTHAPAYPIAINDNVVDLQVTAAHAGEAATLSWRPQAPGWKVHSSVVTTEAGGEPQVQVLQEGSTVEIAGEVPEGYKPVVRIARVADPSAFARSLFVQELEKAGVAVDAPAEGPNPTGAFAASPSGYAPRSRVARLESLPLSEVVTMTEKISHNVVANTLVLDMAATEGGTTMAEGLAVEKSALASLGLDPVKVSLGDGEGGVRADLVSPRAMVDLLAAMRNSELALVYRDSLPILGVDGTIASSVPASDPARGKVWAKTGTTIDGDLLNQRYLVLAKGLAGYADTKSGRHVAFAVYVSDLPAATTDEAVGVGDDLGAIASIIQQGF